MVCRFLGAGAVRAVALWSASAAAPRPGRVRIDFLPDSPLPGHVIVRPKQDAQVVWWGTYQSQEGDQPGLKWDIELRKAED